MYHIKQYLLLKETVKVLAVKGQKRVASVTSGERGTTTTIICAMSASGIYVPPMFIFRGQRISHTYGRHAPEGSIIRSTRNGWTNTEMFMMWLQHFAHYVTPTKDSPVLLVLDNHSSHISMPAYDFCMNNYIHMLSLPPHTSHRMQPLDVSFYGPLKQAYYREANLFIKSRNLAKTQLSDLPGYFKFY